MEHISMLLCCQGALRGWSDTTEMGHSCEGKLLLSHVPRWVGGGGVDRSFVEQPGGGRWPVQGSDTTAGDASAGDWAEVFEDFSGDVALEDAHDFAGGLAFGAASSDVVTGPLIR